MSFSCKHRACENFPFSSFAFVCLASKAPKVRNSHVRLFFIVFFPSSLYFYIFGKFASQTFWRQMPLSKKKSLLFIFRTINAIKFIPTKGIVRWFMLMLESRNLDTKCWLKWWTSCPCYMRSVAYCLRHMFAENVWKLTRRI